MATLDTPMVLALALVLLLPSALMALGEESARHPPSLEPGPWHPDKIPEGVEPPDNFDPSQGEGGEQDPPPIPPPDQDPPDGEDEEAPEVVCTQGLIRTWTISGTSDRRNEEFQVPSGVQQLWATVNRTGNVVSLSLTWDPAAEGESSTYSSGLGSPNEDVNVTLSPVAGPWTLEIDGSGVFNEVTTSVIGVWCE